MSWCSLLILADSSGVTALLPDLIFVSRASISPHWKEMKESGIRITCNCQDVHVAIASCTCTHGLLIRLSTGTNFQFCTCKCQLSSIIILYIYTCTCMYKPSVQVFSRYSYIPSSSFSESSYTCTGNGMVTP